MTLYKRNPVFCTLLLVLSGTAVAGLWYFTKLNGELEVLKSEFETKRAQYNRYVVAKPTPTKKNLEAFNANYAELYDVFDETMRVLNLNTYDQDAMFGVMPESRADWSFAVHKYIEDARFSALSGGIELPDECQFGMTRFAKSSPKPEEMARVHKEIAIMDNVLENLFDSGIESFVSIERGVPPVEKKPARSSRRNQESVYDSDEFEVSKSITMAVPDVLKAYTFQISFKGQSIALRSFLNRIVNSPLPYAVRGIEVDLARELGSKSELESLADNPFILDGVEDGARSVSSVPIISDNSSLFVVTLEFIEMEGEIEKPQFALKDQKDNDDV